MILYLCLFFFFKQKTAYEMRISDWSSDVCSSDLGECQLPRFDLMKRVRAGNDRTDLASATGRSLVLARTNQFIVFQRIAEMALDQIFQKLLPLLKLLGGLGDR